MDKNGSDLKIVIIGFYYGKFPEWMQYWLRSCADNPSIDFLIVTDIELDNIPSNVRILNLSLSDVKRIFKKKLNINVSLERAYKLCDYKPLYGVLLKEYIDGYDYWGHCDFDLIWGNIRKFVTEYHLEQYDKFLPLGHLSLYQNNDKVNNYYKLDGSKCGDYKRVLENDRNYAFDETDGIFSIYEYNQLPMFIKRIFAEIKTYHKRFRLKKCDRNYKHQVFYYEDGNVCRAYEEHGKIKKEEYIYIHFRRKLPVNTVKTWNALGAFYITPKGFVDKEPGIIPTVAEIEKYNHNSGLMYELAETAAFCLKNITKVRSKIEGEIIALKCGGKNDET